RSLRVNIGDTPALLTPWSLGFDLRRGSRGADEHVDAPLQAGGLAVNDPLQTDEQEGNAAADQGAQKDRQAARQYPNAGEGHSSHHHLLHATASRLDLAAPIALAIAKDRRRQMYIGKFEPLDEAGANASRPQTALHAAVLDASLLEDEQILHG